MGINNLLMQTGDNKSALLVSYCIQQMVTYCMCFCIRIGASLLLSQFGSVHTFRAASRDYIYQQSDHLFIFLINHFCQKVSKY